MAGKIFCFFFSNCRIVFNVHLFITFCLQSPVMEEGITLTVKHSNKKGMKGHKHWPVNTRGEFCFLLSKKEKEKTFVLYYHVGLPATFANGIIPRPIKQLNVWKIFFILNKLKT